MEYYLVLKRKELLTRATLDEPWRHDTKLNKSVIREQIFKKYFDAILCIKKIFGCTTQDLGSQFPN